MYMAMLKGVGRRDMGFLLGLVGVVSRRVGRAIGRVTARVTGRVTGCAIRRVTAGRVTVRVTRRQAGLLDVPVGGARADAVLLDRLVTEIRDTQTGVRLGQVVQPRDTPPKLLTRRLRRCATTRAVRLA